MDNIINFQDKKKKNTELSVKEEMILTLDKMKEYAEKEEFTGFLALGLGKDNKIYSIISGEFDIILAVGGIETLKQQLLISTSIDDDD